MDAIVRHCYCAQLHMDPHGTLQCAECKMRFHLECLDSPIVSALQGDVFYTFKCKNCSSDGKEEHERCKMPWHDALTLTLYNLQLGVGGKCGYFRYKEHICAFLDKHWILIFGPHRKKTSTWQATVSGTLSSNCPHRFLSGNTELGETGWWKLTEMKPPLYSVDPPPKIYKRARLPGHREVTCEPGFDNNIIDRPRRSRSLPFSLTAAMELKARRLPDTDPTCRRKRMLAPAQPEPFGPPSPPLPDDAADASGQLVTFETLTGQELFLPQADSPHTATHSDMGESLVGADGETPTCGNDVMVVKTDPYEKSVSILVGMDMNSDNEDLEIDPGSFSPADVADFARDLRRSPDMEDLMMYIQDKQETMPTPSTSHLQSTTSSGQSSKTQVSLISETNDLDPNDPNSESDCPSEREEDKEVSGAEEEEEEEDSEEEEGMGEEEEMEGAAEERIIRRRRKRKITEEEMEDEEEEEVLNNLHLMSQYDEALLLKRLNKSLGVEPAFLPPWEAENVKLTRNILRRKLIVRQIKRKKGLPVFDLDTAAMTMLNSDQQDQQQQQEPRGIGMPMNKRPQGWERTLDRFLLSRKESGNETQPKSFHSRLFGSEGDYLQPITSPYTMRVLKPFIWRNQKTMPPKVKLMQDIMTYPHRNDPTWKAPPPASLDYCYVRPQHLPALNALCHTFFWPGIDLAECLQYPDFSCVVMYKKLVVAFAFLVPDVKKSASEAYISFIFTRPDWRGAGIGTFMLYHLIQTCIGKDVTLHVSATNPAMLLYNKFGFKAEELCLNFYDKYFPTDSRECRHAFFMRLKR